MYAHSVYSTMDTAFHPDFSGKAFLPGNQMPMESTENLSDSLPHSIASP